MTGEELIIENEDGKEIICEILFTCHNDEWNKDYIILKTEDDEYLYKEYIEESELEGDLYDVINEEEIKYLDKLLKEYYESDDTLA